MYRDWCHKMKATKRMTLDKEFGFRRRLYWRRLNEESICIVVFFSQHQPWYLFIGPCILHPTNAHIVEKLYWIVPICLSPLYITKVSLYRVKMIPATLKCSIRKGCFMPFSMSSEFKNIKISSNWQNSTSLVSKAFLLVDMWSV